MNFVINKAKSVLVWIKRFSYEFDDPWVVKRLFETFVIPIIEYGTQIWSPTAECDKVKIESIQKQFLLYALRKFDWYRRDKYKLPSYKHRLLFFHMNTLEDRRKINQIIFIISLMYAKITSPKLLSDLNFRVRQNEFNIRIRHRNEMNNYLLNESRRDIDCPFIMMKKNFNKYYNLIDFNETIMRIKKNLKNHFALDLTTN